MLIGLTSKFWYIQVRICNMSKIVDDILEILKGNGLIQNTCFINYDETPSGG